MFIVDDAGAGRVAAGGPRVIAPTEWAWTVSDWYDQTVCFPTCGAAPYPANWTSLLGWYLSPEANGQEPIPDAVVVNNQLSGTSVFYGDPNGPPQLVRLLNAAASSMYNFSVDGLPLTVVELDGVAVSPLDVPYLVLSIAQRAVVLLDWSKRHSALATSPALLARVSALTMYDPPLPGGANSTVSTLAGAPALFVTQWTGLISLVPASPTQPGAPSYDTADTPVLSAPASLETDVLDARPWPLKPAPAPTQFVDISFGFANDASGVNKAYLNNATYVMAPASMAVPVLRSFMGGAPLAVPAALGGRILGDAMSPFVLPFRRVVQINITNLDNGRVLGLRCGRVASS